MTHKLMNQARDKRFRVLAKADQDAASLLVYNESEAELLVHGTIGDEWAGLDSLSVERWLAARRDLPVTIRVNSTGGFAFDGISIANALSEHPAPTTAIITGVAASAAADLVQGADKRQIYENAAMMLHNAWTLAAGNKTELRDVADFLDKIDQQLIAMLARRSGKSRDQLRQILDGNVDGTWYTGEEAVAEGFADQVIRAKAQTPETVPAAADNVAAAAIWAQRRQMAGRFEELDVAKK